MEKYVTKFLAGLRDRGNVEQMFDIFPDIYFYIKDRNCRWITCNTACLRLLNFRDQQPHTDGVTGSRRQKVTFTDFHRYLD